MHSVALALLEMLTGSRSAMWLPAPLLRRAVLSRAAVLSVEASLSSGLHRRTLRNTWSAATTLLLGGL